MKRILLHKENKVLSVLLDKNNHAVDIGCFEEGGSNLGSILIGRVKDVVKNIPAAFVDIGTDVNAYLPLDDLGEHTVFTRKNGKKAIVPGDEILVQISREPIKTKPASVTTKLSISGKYAAVVADGRTSVSFSKKISDTEFKNTLRPQLKELLTPGFSIILRTNSEGADTNDILAEVKDLQEKLSDIYERAPYQTNLSHLYDPLPDWLSDLRDTRDDSLDEVITDDEAIYRQIYTNVSEILGADVKLRLYDDRQLPLIKAYSIEKILSEALNKHVWLKSGGYLVIEPTECLTAIDVNSGKSDYKGGGALSAYKLNLEAAKEAARQIRLRNLSGIIIIDFVNMADEEMKEQLLKELRGFLAQDRVKTTLVGMTRLELTEVTRKKVHKPLYQTGVETFIG